MASTGTRITPALFTLIFGVIASLIFHARENASRFRLDFPIVATTDRDIGWADWFGLGLGAWRGAPFPNG
jgi:hypothetical protein